jgi:ABC-type branched-subunit amino acid transport system substrate-binding protein
MKHAISLFSPMGLLIAGVIALTGCNIGGTTAPASTGPLVMGELLPMTGRFPQGGRWQLAGAVTAVYDINQNGGVLGRTIQPILGDTAADPVDAVNAWHQIALYHPTFVVGPSCLDEDTVVKLMDPAKTVDFIVGGCVNMNQNPYKYVWRPAPSDSTLTAAMASYAIKQGYKNCAIMMEDVSNSFGQVAPLTADYTKLGGTVAATQKLEPGQTSYRTEVAQAFSGTQPDCVFTSADPQTLSTLFAAAQQLNHLVPFIGDDSIPAPEVVKAIGASVDQKWVVGMAQTPPGGGAYSHYVTVQKVASPASEPSTAATFIYDGVIIAALAMTAANSTDPTVWVNWIDKVTSNESAQVVSTYADGVAALKAGKQIDYDGAVGPEDFNQYHNTFGSWDVVQYDGSANFNPIATISAEDIAKVLG